MLPTTPGDRLRPAALLVHGGGWQRRSPDDMDEIAKRLAERGYVTVNIAYRFAPTYRFPAQFHDLQQAMGWIHERADAWRIDTDRIAGIAFLDRQVREGLSTPLNRYATQAPAVSNAPSKHADAPLP